MAKPPGGNDDLEGRKTRFVPRNDLVDGEAGKGAGGNRLTQGAPGEATPAAAATPAASPTPDPGGTVIGRTRLVGLGPRGEAPSMMPGPAADPMASAPKAGGASGAAKTTFVRSDSAPIEPVVGWVVIVGGPGRGGYKPVFVGMNALGRDASQRICLDFGDESISREEHAFITYDDELRQYWVQSGSKSNVVRLGDETLASPKELKVNDIIHIGKTALRFYPVCSADFSWADEVGGA